MSLPISIAPATRLRGEVTVPGDKSICHRALLLGAIAQGETVVENGSPFGQDPQSTARCLRALGVTLAEEGATRVRIRGAGLRGFSIPASPLGCGNSGTTMRLLCGLLAGQPGEGGAGRAFEAILDGDDSLRRRPMRRIAEPLARMGARIDLPPSGTAPIRVRGSSLSGVDHDLTVASAQVKSALLLAGLYADGDTRVREPAATRDHTERMLLSFGVPVDRTHGWLHVRRAQPLSGHRIDVPGDLSSAAFLLAAALILPGSRITVRGVGVNPTRTGILDLWRRMGAALEISPGVDLGHEPTATIAASHGDMEAIEVAAGEVPRAIDELPIWAVTAAFARGRSVLRGARELRVKESDRVATIAANLTAMGVPVEVLDDGLVIDGGHPLSGAAIRTHGDHRIAMAFAVAALCARGPTALDDGDCISVSFPGFLPLLDRMCER